MQIGRHDGANGRTSAEEKVADEYFSFDIVQRDAVAQVIDQFEIQDAVILIGPQCRVDQSGV